MQDPWGHKSLPHMAAAQGLQGNQTNIPEDASLLKYAIVADSVAGVQSSPGCIPNLWAAQEAD